MEQQLPVVGLIPLWDETKNSLWMLPGYMEGLREAGCTSVMFPLTDDIQAVRRLVSMTDGILFTGGHDVDPALYGEPPSELLGPLCPERDRMETLVLQEALAQGKAILGICRGIQFINAALGGTLYQDLPAQHPSEVDHHQGLPYHAPIHTVRLSGPLQQQLGREELGVNSLHHQAVKVLAPGLQAMAAAPDGIVEALCMPGHPFLWAVQWHPEFSRETDPASREIFRAFAEAMRK